MYNQLDSIYKNDQYNDQYNEPPLAVTENSYDLTNKPRVEISLQEYTDFSKPIESTDFSKAIEFTVVEK